MGQPYVGEVRMFAGNFAPAGWMTCDGQILPISEYDTLFNLIGTTYGGDGQSTFQLPNLAGKVPLHMGNGGTGTTYVQGQAGGVSSVTLTTNQIPQHTHPIVADANNATTTQQSPQNDYYGNTSPNHTYSTIVANVHPMMAGTLIAQGGSQPHDNMQPYQALTFIISLFGIYPSPN